MAEEKKEEKKIVVDEDWKQQAQKEKDVLAAQEEAEKEKTGKRHRTLPKGDFQGLVSMLFTQTLFSLGFIQVKEEEKREPDLALAKYNIDMLEMLEEKTRGNLTEDEKQVLANTLNELRMAYVKVAEAVEKQQQKS